MLRWVEDSDAAALLRIYAPVVEHTAVSFEFEPPSVSEMRDRVRAVRAAARPWLVFERDGVLVGYSYASSFRARPAYQWIAEVAVYVDPGARGHGVARALYTAVLRGLEWQGYRSAIGVITMPNAASVALHQSLGFEPVGVIAGAGQKFDTWHDIAIWQKTLAPLDTRPAPKASAEVCRGAAWKKFLNQTAARVAPT